MPLLTRNPPPFNDAPGLPTSRHTLPGSAGVFFRLPVGRQNELKEAQRRDPYGENGLVQLERIVAEAKGARLLSAVEGAAIELTIAAIEAETTRPEQAHD